MRKKGLTFLAIIICLFMAQISPINASTTYSVKRILQDGTYENLYNTSSYEEALRYYDTNQDESNYAILMDDKIVKVRYGIVSFAEGKGCNYTVSYANAINNQSGYTNGCYGADGLYLETNNSLTKVMFQLSNVLGWAKMSDVTIYPFEAFTTYSTYFKEGNHLYHQIKTNMQKEAYGATIDLGEAPSYLAENTTYYSYDGKYFYTDFKAMRNDVYHGVHEHAVNYQTPYYNYYQYVTNRTLTQYSEEELNNYITNILGITSSMTQFYDKNGDSISEILNHSQYHNSASSLLQYQYQYGANALMILAISSNETASGRSALAFYRNNLFGHAAYDSNVEANASRYNSVDASIASHAKNYISNNYSNPKKFMYHGSFFGDKGSGMNVSYASDPYWGEKAAQYYMRIDSELGGKDKNAYAIGIKSNAKDIPIYTLPSGYSTVLYTTGPNWDYPFILLSEIYSDGEYWYKVQADPSINDKRETTGIYYYDFEDMFGYIRQSDVQYILNSDKVASPTYTTSIYDAKAGKFTNNEQLLEITHPNSSYVTITPPVLDGAIFQEFIEVDDHYYEAIYKMVDHAWIEGDYQSTYIVGESLNLKNMNLMVMYTDGTKDCFPVNTSMVSAVSFNEEGAKTFTVTYQGVSAEGNALVIPKDSTLAIHVSNQFNEFYALHPLETVITEEELALFKNIVKNSKDYGVIFSNDEIRYIDEVLRESYASKLQIKIENNPLDLNFSGLSFLIDLDNLQDNRFPSTLFVNTKEVGTDLENRFIQIIEGNGWHYYDAFEVEMLHKKEPINLETNYLVSIAKPKDHDLSKAYILLTEKDGDIYRFYGKQTDTRITFQTQGFTKFAIAYQNTNNIYSSEDMVEAYRIENNGYDVQVRMLTIGGFAIGSVIVLFLLIHFYLKSPNKKEEKEHKQTIELPTEPIRLSNVSLEEINEQDENKQD